MSTEHSNNSPVMPSIDSRSGTNRPIPGTTRRGRARTLAHELVLLTRTNRNLSIIVTEGDHQTQYRNIIAPNGHPAWVRVAQGNAPVGLAGTRAAPDFAAEQETGDDVISIWLDTISRNRIVEELFDAIADKGHPIRDELPEFDVEQPDTTTIELRPVEDAPDPGVSLHRAFEDRAPRPDPHGR
jgi:hypothetical protein